MRFFWDPQFLLFAGVLAGAAVIAGAALWRRTGSWLGWIPFVVALLWVVTGGRLGLFPLVWSLVWPTLGGVFLYLLWRAVRALERLVDLRERERKEQS